MVALVPEDNESIHSTVSIDNVVDSLKAGAKRKEQQQQQRRRSARVVRFDEKRNSFHEHRHGLCDQDIEALWYTDMEYKVIRQTYRSLIQEIMLRDKRWIAQKASGQKPNLVLYKTVMEQTYEQCCHVASEETEKNHKKFSVLRSELQRRRLSKVVQMSPARVGLERQTLKESLGLERKIRLSYLVQKIRRIQPNGGFADCSLDDYERQAERIRNACLSITRPSRFFAREHAHALVMNNEE